mmetsp:Transcript_79511/g.170401  ORF Transcript_79511/g.170401 Transcript_79511/m.170401 type:complete len:87 (+) Transcript_79511:222-482(+)
MDDAQQLQPPHPATTAPPTPRWRPTPKAMTARQQWCLCSSPSTSWCCLTGASLVAAAAVAAAAKEARILESVSLPADANANVDNEV